MNVIPLIAGLFAVLVSSFAQQVTARYSIAPEPDWVAPIPAPDIVMEGDAPGGVAYLVYDEQVNVATESVYARHWKRLTSESGVQDESQISFTYEPSHQRLELHKITLWRNGRELNRLDPTTLRVVQQEHDAYRQIYNGEESVIAILQDVRVGDELEYSFTVRGFNPTFAGKFASTHVVQWGVPLRRSGLRVVWPDEKGALFHKAIGFDAEPTVSRGVGVSEYSWQFTNMAALEIEDRLPYWFTPYPRVQLSSFANWDEVRNWAAAIYLKPVALSSELQAQIGRLRDAHPAPEAFLRAALKFAQDEVRYLGIEIGANSHQPTDPSTVFERRFGDCKDKTVLFCEMLRQAGITAHPALVNTYSSAVTHQRLPSPLAFNHVIARVTLGEETLWLDPTLTHQKGSLREQSVDEYAQLLVVDPNESGLAVVQRKPLARPTKIVNEYFTIHTYEGPADLRVVTQLEGEEATTMRRALANTGVQELQKLYLEFYQGIFKTITNSQPLLIEEDKTANRYTVEENYHLDKPWTALEGEKRYAQLSAHSITDTAVRPSTVNRKMPLRVPYPRFLQHNLIMSFPEKGRFKAEEKVISDPAQRFSFKSTVGPSNVVARYEYRTFQDSVPVSSVGEFLKNLEEVHEFSYYALTLPKLSGEAERVNWPVTILAVLALSVLGAASVICYRYRPVIPPPIEPADPKLVGLRGWLILVGIGLFTTPIWIGVVLAQSVEPFAPETWHALTTPGADNYHPLWAVVLVGELFGNLTLLALSMLLLVLFFQRRKTFPRFYIAFLILNTCIVFGDLAIGQAIPAVVEELGPKDYSDAFRTGMRAMIWTAYMLKSKRVKWTFVH